MKRTVLLTRRELAALPDLPGQAGPVHMQTVTKWEHSGMPVAERGRKGRPSRYSEADVRAWLAAREAAMSAPDAPLDLEVERARKEHWQALLAEQTHRARERELLPRAEVERVWGAERDAVKGKLLSLPVTHADRVHRAGALDGVPGVERALKEMVYEVLRELAAGAGDQPVEAPAKRRGKRSRRAA